MTIIVVLVLCGVWAAYLVPPMLRDRGVGVRRASAENGLSAIGSVASRVLTDSQQTGPTQAEPAVRSLPSATTTRGIDSLMPSGSVAARQRRTVVIGALAAFAVISLFAVPVFGFAALVLHIGFDALLVGMGYLTYKRSLTPSTGRVYVRLTSIARFRINAVN